MVWALPGVNSQGLNSGLGKGMGQAGGASGDAWRMDRGVPAVLRNYRHLQGVAAGGVGGKQHPDAPKKPWGWHEGAACQGAEASARAHRAAPRYIGGQGEGRQRQERCC